ncbi:DNA polymerase [Anaerovibrio lipolyticus DSM 3074]|uniref:DNA-directed DNA polymerase n=2 Tax=Anaerovibrio lipolyticus TaxID=82374 RepID=A0A0B2JY35_9FIRM|nr:DNA polymerase [Anaerovibrio lipolyticus]KHM51618.1 XRE family transcriptional regulator [Anaerovibrio lipolyticus]SHI78605.1 DNA polymerase [Anaerovibrio lipolyticus DSM 3074]
MRTLYIDIETYSDKDIKCGVHKYVGSNNFEILLFAYAFDNEEPTVIDLTKYKTLPWVVVDALESPDVLKTAFNANFELTCLAKAFPNIKLDDSQWECDSILSLYHSYPPGLGVVAQCLGLEEDKQKDIRGKTLIKYFCVPCKPTKKNGGRTRNLPEHDPEGWEVFKEYNAQDVVAERAIREALLWLKPTEAEHELWLVDRAINSRGIAIDKALVKNAIKLNEEYSEELTERAQKLTALDNPNSIAQLKEWFKMNGHPVSSLTKDVVDEMLQDENIHPVLKEVLNIRQKLGKTSVKKYEAMKSSICKDGKVRDLFQFYGASRTGRWAGRNIQLQNLTKNYLDDLDTARDTVKSGDLAWTEMLYGNVTDLLSQLVRTSFIPSLGNKFIVADFSAIEARVIAWLANEKWRMDAFANGEDIYCASASQMFGVPVVKHGINGELRQRGKVAELALGYGGGVQAMKAMGGDKLDMTDEELQEIVNKWRAASPKIPALWRAIEFAAMRTIKYGGTHYVIREHNIFFDKHDNDLILHLPNGRCLVYLNAGIGENRFGNESIEYDGLVQTTHKMGRLETYGGKLTENLVQAVARDCLGAAMVRLEKAGYKIVGHVHDEVICDVPDNGQYTLSEAVRIMSENTDWNQGLLLNADGFESYYYMKD